MISKAFNLKLYELTRVKTESVKSTKAALDIERKSETIEKLIFNLHYQNSV